MGKYSHEHKGWVQTTFDIEPETPLASPQMTLCDLIRWQRDISATRSGPIIADLYTIPVYFAALMTEAGECLNELNWKPWKANHPVDTARVLDEFADIQAFVYLIGDLINQVTGTTPEDLYEAYLTKSQVNRDRLAGKVTGYEKGDRNELSRET
jgi:hypothetical protein